MKHRFFFFNLVLLIDLNLCHISSVEGSSLVDPKVFTQTRIPKHHLAKEEVYLHLIGIHVGGAVMVIHHLAKGEGYLHLIGIHVGGAVMLQSPFGWQKVVVSPFMRKPLAYIF